MTMIIEIQSRDWDVENITAALVIPAQREYVAHLTVDEPDAASIVFDGDVQLKELDGDRLTVSEWSEDVGYTGVMHTFDVADIRRIEFY